MASFFSDRQNESYRKYANNHSYRKMRRFKGILKM